MSFLEIKNLSIGYDKPLFESINLSAEKGEVIAIIGLNGVGKSTFLKTLVNINKELAGQVLLNNKNKNDYTKFDISKKIGFSSVHNLTVQHFTVRELVSMGRVPYTSLMGNLNEDDKKAVNDAIESAGLYQLAEKEILKISDGERQRAYIARLIAQQTDILLFDEPTAFLDVIGKHKIVSLFRQITTCSDKILIFSTHDLKIAIQNADKIWLFNAPVIIEGAPEDLIIDGTFNKLFSDSNLIFNNFTADFDVKNIELGTVNIIQKSKSENRFNWTINAFYKIGFNYNKNSNTDIEIHDNSWVYKKNSTKLKFKTLYKLLKYIQNAEKN